MQPFKGLVRAYIRSMQRLFITVLLFLLYMFGFGAMALIMLVVRPRSFRENNGDSFWCRAEGYPQTLEESVRES